MKGKYIVMDNGEMGTPYAVIFNPIESHATMAEKMGGKIHCLGAGEWQCWEQDNKFYIHCYGKSSTLGIVSRKKEDALEVKFVLFDSNGYEEIVIV